MTHSSPLPTTLITGCAGFIGTRLAKRLLASDESIVALDDLSTVGVSFLQDADNGLYHPVEGSILDESILPTLKQRYPSLVHIVHLAAVVSVPYSFEFPEKTIETNFHATRRLHSQARELGFQSFVFAGSAAEYGETPERAVEEGDALVPPWPSSPYGQAKRDASLAIADSGFGCSLRFFNAFGPGQLPSNPYSGVVSRFIHAALNSEPINIFGDGEQVRDFVFVDDIVSAILLARGDTSHSPVNGTFNVGGRIPTTINKLAQAIIRVVGSHSEICHFSPREGDIQYSLANIDRFVKEVGYRPQITLEDGLRRTLEWMKQNNQS